MHIYFHPIRSLLFFLLVFSSIEGAESSSIRDSDVNITQVMSKLIPIITCVLNDDTTPPETPRLIGNLSNNTIRYRISASLSGETGSAIYINGEYYGLVPQSGTVSLLLTLHPGQNNFSIILKDSSGNSSSPLSFTIRRQLRFPIHDKAEASRFLSRATFGATYESIENLYRIGDYEAWIEEQFRIHPTLHMQWIHSHAIGINGTPNLYDHLEDWKHYSDALGTMQRDAWWDIVVNAPDQLRQRMAFALSEIFVISRNGPLQTFPDARVSYYDLLVNYAFDNFETLLQNITYHPAMGKYLSYLGNRKSDPAVGNHPDENYAREVMQLFTIGLYELERNGTKKYRHNQPVATYTQQDIREMAKIFTGLSDDNGIFETEGSFSSFHARTSPMVPFETYHDTSEKKILHAHYTIPAGGNTIGDINAALHQLFIHDNTAPFISKQLIQRLVTSNPSAGYVERVARVFENNGNGVRGDLKAVIKAILLDDESLRGRNDSSVFGKFREPLLYVSHLFRAFHAQNAVHTLKQGDTPLYRYRSYNFNGTGMTKQEGPLEALTVFNYFTPDDGPAALKRQHLVAPELELYGKQGIDDVLMGLITENGFVYRLFNITAKLQLQREIALIHDNRYEDFVDELDLVLTGNTMEINTKEAIVHYLQTHRNDENMTLEKLVRLGIGLVMTSPDYALQR